MDEPRGERDDQSSGRKSFVSHVANIQARRRGGVKAERLDLVLIVKIRHFPRRTTHPKAPEKKQQKQTA